jgi:hypothetical protein
MSNQPSTENDGRHRTVLPTRWLIALVVGMCVVVGVVGGVAKDVGPDLGGDVGLWLGWGVTFLVAFVMCWIVARRFANPNLPVICAALLGVGFSEPAEAAARHLVGERWVKPIGFLTAVLAVAVFLTIFKRMAERQKA